MCVCVRMQLSFDMSICCAVASSRVAPRDATISVKIIKVGMRS